MKSPKELLIEEYNHPKTSEKRKKRILDMLGTTNIQGVEKTKAGVNPGDSEALTEAKLKQKDVLTI